MSRLSSTSVDALLHAGLDPAAVEAVLVRALAEDLGLGPDVTSEATVPAGLRGAGEVRARAAGVIAGVPVAQALVDLVAGGLRLRPLVADGDRVAPGQAVLVVDGPLRAMLRTERTLLNLLCHLSGIATATRSWVEAVAGTGAAIRDTRKTLPGLRALQKYAVRCGGGVNHRLALGDAVLVKDNHVAAAGGVTEAVRAVLAAAAGLPVQVECDTLDQVAEALAAGARSVLLDNMAPATLRQAVGLAREWPGVTLEASGGLTLDRAREVAETGVDYLAVGALTHSAVAVDLGLDVPADPPGTLSRW